MTLTELSSVTGISKSNLNQILNKLQKNKQIKRYRKMDSRIILREKIIEFRNDEPQVME
ncbi:MAG: MarR family transcriptional regulator [Thaumarchaeota archaeon]|nr:MarR family transcriptional regulator [Nitrososphaerota archaeon]